MKKERLSRGRILVILAVLILGAIWFLTPKTQTPPDYRSESSLERDDLEKTSDAAMSATGALASKTETPPKTAEEQLPSSRTMAATDTKSSARSKAFERFQASSVRQWTARNKSSGDGFKTLVRGLWTSGNAADYRTSAETFVKDYSESLLGVRAEQLQFEKEEVTDRTKIIYAQNIEGTPVYGATLALFFENGGLTRVQNDLLDAMPVTDEPVTVPSIAEAFASWNVGAGAHYELLSSAKSQAVYYPGSATLIPAYDFVVRDQSDRKTYRILYDAVSGHTIKKSPTQIR